jgi:hypothetical protein
LSKLVIIAAAFLSVSIGAALGGVYWEKQNLERKQAEGADIPRAILGLVVDGHWMGACVTSQDYKLHCIQGDQLPLKSAAEIGKSLPEQSAMISNMSTPCGKQQDTKRDDGV